MVQKKYYYYFWIELVFVFCVCYAKHETKRGTLMLTKKKNRCCQYACTVPQNTVRYGHLIGRTLFWYGQDSPIKLRKIYRIIYGKFSYGSLVARLLRRDLHRPAPAKHRETVGCCHPNTKVGNITVKEGKLGPKLSLFIHKH